MAFSHRPLEDKDVQEICRFPQSEEELFFSFPKAQYPLTPIQVMNAVSGREDPSVVILNGEVVGYANFIKVRPDIFCTLGNLLVNPFHRRKGVATYLVNTMIHIAKEKYKARFVRAACFSHNSAGYQLYRGMGFKPADMVHRTTPDGETVLLVNMELACKQR